MLFAVRLRAFVGALLAVATLVAAPPAWGQEAGGKFPSAAAVAQLLRDDPVTPQSWPAWRQRTIDWLGDPGDDTMAGFEAVAAFVKSQATPAGDLPPPYATDPYAWYFLAGGYAPSGRDFDPAAFQNSERALRRCLALDPKLARAHARLAGTLVMRFNTNSRPGAPAPIADPLLTEAEKELQLARQLDPQLPTTHYYEALLALCRKKYPEAESHLRQYLAKRAAKLEPTRMLARTIVMQEQNGGTRTARVQPLAAQFPNDGELLCILGLAQAVDGDAREAVRTFNRARELGADPAEVLSPGLVAEIEAHGGAPWYEVLAWVMGGFAAFYAAVMASMAVGGLVLARYTRGAGALKLLGEQPDELVGAGGQVARTGSESLLGRLYALALFAGLVLFYLAVPFVILGLVGATAAFVLALVAAGRIPVKLLVIGVVVGLGMAWAVLKSVFTKPGEGSFGVKKSADDCPRLHEMLEEVARRVDTEPISEVYIAPGAAVGVHQVGRGPFGMFGVKKRVLTIGVSAMDCMTITELKAVLAHEYAHFSHKDTFYSRFIYQVSQSIDTALRGMGATGGVLNYVNPFYWFLYLYERAYQLLAAGYSRSREFLADRMAATLYGSDEFAGALRKVSAEGGLFESTMYAHVSNLLADGKSFINMYEAFRAFRDEQLPKEEREKLYQHLLEEKGSIFASHPTFPERLEAVAGLPKAVHVDGRKALDLFEDPAAIEKELTEFLTGYLAHIRHLQAMAAAQQG